MGRTSTRPSAGSREKLSAGTGVTNGTGGQRTYLLRATLVISIRWSGYWYAARGRNPSEGTGVARGVTPFHVEGWPSDGAQRVPQRHPEYKKAYFAGRRGSARIRSLVWRHFEQEIQAQIKTEAGRKMALKCEFCGKAPHYGNVISHANNTRRRRWNPNLKRVHAVVAGVKKQVRVCTACIRAGKVKKAA
jgi:large subunit ribosomal protein L28